MHTWLQRYPLFILVTLFFLLRLTHLTLLPPFNDEAIYLDWAQRAANTTTARFYSLHDGKSPLTIWLFTLASSTISDPLLAGRLVSVTTGVISLVGIYHLAAILFDRRLALTSALLYATSPLFIFFDRQALMESSLTAVGLWTLLLLLRLHRDRHLKHALLLALTLSIGVYTKTTGFLFILLFIIAGGYLLARTSPAHKPRLINLLATSFFVSQLLLLPLYAHRQFIPTLTTNSRYLVNPSLSGLSILKLWSAHTLHLADILFWHLTPPVFLLSTYGAFIILARKQPRLSTAAIWLSAGLIVLLLMANHLNPRYLVPFSPLLLIFAAYVLVRKLAPLYLFLPAVLALSLFISLVQIISPTSYFNLLHRVTKFSQRHDYVTNWTAGYATRQALDFIKPIVQDQPIVIAIRLDAGNPESAINAYYPTHHPRVTSAYFDNQHAGVDLSQYDCVTAPRPIYYLSRDYHTPDVTHLLNEIARFYNPEGTSSVGIYQAKIGCDNSVELQFSFAK